MPSIKAQVQAAIAASVGVNQPKVMPPTMMIGVISAGRAAMKVLNRTSQRNAWSRPMP